MASPPWQVAQFWRKALASGNRIGPLSKGFSRLRRFVRYFGQPDAIARAGEKKRRSHNKDEAHQQKKSFCVHLYCFPRSRELSIDFIGDAKAQQKAIALAVQPRGWRYADVGPLGMWKAIVGAR